jgi:curli biogenesis system outer membrane secretion channel CsgG
MNPILLKGKRMKFLRSPFVALLVLSLLAGLANGQVKKRIAVSTFNDGSGYHGGGTGVSDMLTTALVKSGKFVVVERKEIEKVLQEQKMGLSGVITEQTAPQVGRMLGVDMLVVGSVSELGTKERSIGGGMSILGAGVTTKTARAAVDIRLVNTTTGEIIAAETEEGTESNLGVDVRYENINFSDVSAWDNTDVGKACREAINGCVELITENMDKIPWSGRIIKVSSDGSIIMKPGLEGNVQNGMLFDVFRLGEELKDPDTGLALGFEESKVGQIKAQGDMLAGKAAKASVVSGTGFKAGDIIRLPE